MFQKTQKAIQKQKDKELLEQQEKIQANKLRILSRVKEEIYPFIKENTKSIDDATIFIESFVMAVKQAHINTMRTMKVKDTGLMDMLNSEEPEVKRWKELLELTGEESIFDISELFENMAREIDYQIRLKISKEQKLEDLKIDIYEKMAD